MSATDVPFLTGHGTARARPLGRYLPPIPTGIASSWLAEHVRPGSLVLDPFGSAPDITLEIARAGYKVLVASNNPINRFLLEMAATRTISEEMHTVLADVAASRKGDERLERHILSLYETVCAGCGRMIIAEAYIWRDGADSPYARLYTCPHCGDRGEHPVIASDLEHLSHLPPSGLHRSRAIERVAGDDDTIRGDVEEALGVYLARPLYILFTLINRLDSLASQPDRQRLLAALLLSAFDDGNTLWSYPSGRPRPKQLSSSPVFMEKNLWLSIEQGVHTWTDIDLEVPLSYWPELAAPGGVTVYQGRLRDLAERINPSQIDAVLMAVPRPNQAFWTLCALWSGWLWGHEAVTPLKSVLTRRRYDWNWHAMALASVTTTLQGCLDRTTPIFTIVPETEPPFLTAVFLACEAAHMSLKSLAQRSESHQTQIEWKPNTDAYQANAATSGEVVAKQGVLQCLEDRGEPSPYLPLHTAALAALSREHAFSLNPEFNLAENHTQVTTGLRRVFLDRMQIVHYGGSDQNLDAGQWWLRDPTQGHPALTSRVEEEIVRYLQAIGGVSVQELDDVICRKFRGLQTPDLEWVNLCLRSYGEIIPGAEATYRLRYEDKPDLRRGELEEVQQLLIQLGQRLGWRVETQGFNPVLWREGTGRVAYVFSITSSSQVERYLTSRDFDPKQSLMVIPGGRAGLITYKLEHNPLLRQAVNMGWRFIKYRHLRAMADNSLLDRNRFDAELNSDPPEAEAQSMAMF